MMKNLIWLIVVFLCVSLSSVGYTANTNKYDWNKKVKWRTNTYGEPKDVCYNYKKGSVDFRQCKKKSKKIFAYRCRYGQKSYCSNKMRRSSSTPRSKRITNVKKVGTGSVLLK